MNKLYKISLSELGYLDSFRFLPDFKSPLQITGVYEDVYRLNDGSMVRPLDKVYIDQFIFNKVLSRNKGTGHCPAVEMVIPFPIDNMNQEYLSRPVSSKRSKGLYPSEEIE